MEILPVCGEILWVDLFIFINISFCMASLLQSGMCMHTCICA